MAIGRSSSSPIILPGRERERDSRPGAQGDRSGCELAMTTEGGRYIVTGQHGESITFLPNVILKPEDFAPGGCEGFRVQMLRFFGKGGKRYFHGSDGLRLPAFVPWGGLGRKPESQVPEE